MSSLIEALGTERVLEPPRALPRAARGERMRDVEVVLVRPEWETRVRARSTMTCDARHFTVTGSLDAYEAGVRVCAHAFAHRFPRDGA